MAHARPEDLPVGATKFFSGEVPQEYHDRNQRVQEELTKSALVLFHLGRVGGSGVVLDLGCGSGLSTKVIEKLLPGSYVIGFDISAPMLEIARPFLKGTSSDVFCGDCGELLPFKDASLSGIISISVIQWLSDEPRIRSFMSEVLRCLQEGGRAIFQLYPTGPAHAELFVKMARSVGLVGHLVMDVPHRTPQKKWFLFLWKQEHQEDRELPSCQLALPFHATCTLCLKESFQEPLFPFEGKLNNPTTTPMEHWLLRFHLVKSLELVKNVQGRRQGRRGAASLATQIPTEVLHLRRLFQTDASFVEYQHRPSS
jgi:SAM-dependent methyltransferase